VSKAWPVRSIDPGDSLAANARRILRVRVGEFYSYELVVDDPTAIVALHDLRISAKRLRYTLELFRSVFAEPGERNIERIKAIQEALGDLHDADVRIALIQEELTSLAAEQIAELGKALLTAPPASRRSLITAALKPPPDDPRRGLLALLGRQYGLRGTHFERFNTLWRRYDADGMRSDLASLSHTPRCEKRDGSTVH
jgi:hypothetical protein